MVYPSLRAYIELPLSEDQGGAADLKIVGDEAGKETVDGHPCVKHKVAITDNGGRNQEGFTWNATDLKDFPSKWSSTDTDATITMTYPQHQAQPLPTPRRLGPGRFHQAALTCRQWTATLRRDAPRAMVAPTDRCATSRASVEARRYVRDTRRDPAERAWPTDDEKGGRLRTPANQTTQTTTRRQNPLTSSFPMSLQPQTKLTESENHTTTSFDASGPLVFKLFSAPAMPTPSWCHPGGP